MLTVGISTMWPRRSSKRPRTLSVYESILRGLGVDPFIGGVSCCDRSGGPGTVAPVSGQNGPQRPDAAAGLLEVGHLLGVAQPDLLAAVLRVGIEGRPGNDRHARTIENDAGRLLAVLEAEVAEIGQHVIRPLRRGGGHAGLAASRGGRFARGPVNTAQIRAPPPRPGKHRHRNKMPGPP